MINKTLLVLFHKEASFNLKFQLIFGRLVL